MPVVRSPSPKLAPMPIKIESKVENPLASIGSFDKQFQFGDKEKEVVEWGWNQEMVGNHLACLSQGHEG